MTFKKLKSWKYYCIFYFTKHFLCILRITGIVKTMLLMLLLPVVGLFYSTLKNFYKMIFWCVFFILIKCISVSLYEMPNNTFYLDSDALFVVLTNVSFVLDVCHIGNYSVSLFCELNIIFERLSIYKWHHRHLIFL